MMQRRARRIRSRRRVALVAGVAVVAAISVAGCGDDSASDGAVSVSGPSTLASTNNSIDPVHIDQITTTVRSRGLPLTGQRDATSELCGSAGCIKAYAFDQLSILKFPTTGRAELYNGSIQDGYQVLDLEVSFPSNTAPDKRTAYEDAIRLAVQ